MIAYTCVNADCFYCETWLDFEDVVYKSMWSSEIGDVLEVAHCPSCLQPMIHEYVEKNAEVHDGALQTLISFEDVGEGE